MVFLIVGVVSTVVVGVVVVVSIVLTVSPVYSGDPKMIAIKINTKKARNIETIIFLTGNNESPV